MRDAASYKIQGAYDFSKTTKARTNLAVRYTYYDLNPAYSISSDGRPQEYMNMLGLQVKQSYLKGGYFTGTFETHQHRARRERLGTASDWRLQLQLNIETQGEYRC